MSRWFFPVPPPPYVCAVSRATWLLFTGVPAWFVVLCLRCPGPLGSRSPVCPLGVLCSAGKGKRPATERLLSWRRRLWQPRPWAPRTPTRTGTTPKTACIMSNVQDLFWCDAREEQGSLLHAPDCDQQDFFVVQERKQETNTGGKAKLPDHYRCTITCAFCGKRRHYEDKCYHKQPLSAKPKTENARGKGGGKGNANKDNGQGKSEGNGKGQGGKGKGGQGCDHRKPAKDKNANPSGGNPNPTPGGNPEPSGVQPNTGPTTRSQTQGQ